jgi:hypothetical protein
MLADCRGKYSAGMNNTIRKWFSSSPYNLRSWRDMRHKRFGNPEFVVGSDHPEPCLGEASFSPTPVVFVPESQDDPHLAVTVPN